MLQKKQKKKKMLFAIFVQSEFLPEILAVSHNHT